MRLLDFKEESFKGDVGFATPLEAKALNEDGEFEGYASVFGERDQGDDIVMPGAFSETLVKRPVDRVKMLRDHRTDQIIGKWVEMREDAKGLYVKGKLLLSVDKGRETHELMKADALDGLSIGFRTLVDEYDRDLGVRRLMKVSLMEVSVVAFPMLESAMVSLVKSGKLPTEREFERYLVRDAGFSARQAKGVVAHGFKSLMNERDAGNGDDPSAFDEVGALAELAQVLRAA